MSSHSMMFRLDVIICDLINLVVVDQVCSTVTGVPDKGCLVFDDGCNESRTHSTELIWILSHFPVDGVFGILKTHLDCLSI